MRANRLIGQTQRRDRPGASAHVGQIVLRLFRPYCALRSAGMFCRAGRAAHQDKMPKGKKLMRRIVTATCVLACLASGTFYTGQVDAAERLQAAPFVCDITPPLGQPMFTGDALKTVEQPLLAKGIVLEADGQRYVVCTLDWCELCNEAHDSFRRSIAKAVGAEPARVAVQVVHQHTAPLVNTGSAPLPADSGLAKYHLDPKVLAAIEARLGKTAGAAVERLEPFDRIGIGQAKVDRVASNRRPVGTDGKIHARFSRCKDPALRALPEGTVDPYLKTITLLRGARPLVRLHYYATHPQTSYGENRASSDIVGDAREALEKTEGVPQIYFTGCAGDITAGKYNDGSPQCRRDLAARLLAGMKASVAATTDRPVGEVHWRTCPVRFTPREDAGYNLADCLACLNDPDAMPFDRWFKGAMRANFHRRIDRPIELSSLQIDDVHILHLPGEPMICFQLFAQKLKPSGFVAVAGYGDGGPGYICSADVFKADGGYEQTASNVVPESETVLKSAIATLLGLEAPAHWLTSEKEISQ